VDGPVAGDVRLSRFGQEDDAGSACRTRLKWFNAAKGFGFVSPVDGAADAFLHVSVLHRAGLQELGDQAEMICEIGAGPKGPQVTRIVQMLNAGVAPPPPPRQSFAQGSETEMIGTVKWFKSDKGFGFITADDSEKDVFVHKSALQRSGLFILETGQRVQMRVQEAAKGREATWVAPL
jgi:CspA family cold shock protein